MGDEKINFLPYPPTIKVNNFKVIPGEKARFSEGLVTPQKNSKSDHGQNNPIKFGDFENASQ